MRDCVLVWHSSCLWVSTFLLVGQYSCDAEEIPSQRRDMEMSEVEMSTLAMKGQVRRALQDDGCWSCALNTSVTFNSL